MPGSGMTNTARLPVALPETASERRLAEAVARPLAFLGETTDYFTRFVKSRGFLRPMTEWMVR